MNRQIIESMDFHPLRLGVFVAALIAFLPTPSQAQYTCYSQSGASGCYFDCGPGNTNFPNGAIHMCTCDGSTQSPPANYGSNMGPACYSIGSHCAPWETYPHSTSNCSAWACTPGQACSASNGCGGTCAYVRPTPGGGGGSPVACFADPSGPTCGDRCCAANEVCSNNVCKPLCGSTPYDPATQCCVNQEVQSKFQITDLAKCPNRAPRPGWDPHAPNPQSSCGSGIFTPLVPNTFGAANFLPGCAVHDSCYDTCNSVKGTCDASFGAALQAECQRAYSGLLNTLFRIRCQGVAGAYRVAVVGFGGGSYENAQKAACICCP